MRSPFSIDWMDPQDVVAYAKELGGRDQCVKAKYHKGVLVGYNICHFSRFVELAIRTCMNEDVDEVRIVWASPDTGWTPDQELDA
jgi:hypothetical protein